MLQKDGSNHQLLIPLGLTAAQASGIYVAYQVPRDVSQTKFGIIRRKFVKRPGYGVPLGEGGLDYLRGEQDVDQQVTSTTGYEESPGWREDDCDEDENNV